MLIPPASAVEYFQNRLFLLNDTTHTQVHAFMEYGKADGTPEHIKDNHPLEVYVEYYDQVTSWNNANTNNQIRNCVLTITKGVYINNSDEVVFNATFIEDTPRTKIFVPLDKGDSVKADWLCTFIGQRTLQTPADFSIVTPTWECKECQLLQWRQDQITVTKAITINSYIVSMFGYIKNFVSMNFDLAIIGFWILVILMLVSAVSLIFVGFYWGYLYIKRLAR